MSCLILMSLWSCAKALLDLWIVIRKASKSNRKIAWNKGKSYCFVFCNLMNYWLFDLLPISLLVWLIGSAVQPVPVLCALCTKDQDVLQNIFLRFFLTSWVMGYSDQVELICKNQIGLRINPFLLRIKKLSSSQIFFESD